jgi:hypothetical protein
LLVPRTFPAHAWGAGGGIHDVNSAISGITIQNYAGHTFTIDKITLYGIK